MARRRAYRSHRRSHSRRSKVKFNPIVLLGVGAAAYLLWPKGTSASEVTEAGPLNINPSIAPNVNADTGTVGTYYTVKSGDSLSKIAAQYGTTWQALYAANAGEIGDPNVIFPGQKLRIP